MSRLDVSRPEGVGDADTDTVEQLLAQLTLAEKCRMVSGDDAWHIPGCDRLGIPGWRVSDGPIGVRGRAFAPGMLFPGPSAMAATWDRDLLHDIGAALAEEAADRGVDMVLAPTVNLQRCPRGGRHFEMFSEDPELSASLAVSYIRGLQGRGVAACIKHFVGNEQEQDRLDYEAQIDERTLREVYLRPFEAAVRESHVRGVMTAYNFVNGDHACSHGPLLQGVLKDEWAFDGVVISDWGALKESVGPARNGCDVEMPGPGRWWGDGKLEAAILSGAVGEVALDDKVRRILGLLAWRGRLVTESTDPPEAPRERPSHRSLARRVATDAMVLIKNESLLPLRADRSVALIGPGAARTAILGGGSSSLRPHRRDSVAGSFRRRWTGDVVHEEGISLRRGGPSLPSSWIKDGKVKVELFDSVDCGGDPRSVEYRTGVTNTWFDASFPSGFDRLSVRLTVTVTPDTSGRYRVAGAGAGPSRLFVDGTLVADNQVDGFPAGLLLSAGTGELALESDHDYEMVLEQAAPEGMRIAITDVRVEAMDQGLEERLATAGRVAAEADVAVVVVGSNDQWETEGSDRRDLELPAEQDALVRRVVEANPRTVVVLNCGGPMLMPWLDDVPAVLLAWYPGQEGADAVLDVLTGAADPGGRMPTTWPRHEGETAASAHPQRGMAVAYGEGLLVGHRWYEANAIEPLVPFGHGLSYTSFEWGVPSLGGSGAALTVDVPVHNVGDRAGSDVVQVYVARRDAPASEPRKVLAGFEKIRLGAGEAGRATVPIGEEAFRRWDARASRWEVVPGWYDVIVAASSTDERGRIAHHLSR